MNNKQIEDLVDLMFDTDMEEVMKEKNTLEYIHKLQQENKQLKEELEKKNKMYWQQQCVYYSSILYSLEKWLKDEFKKYSDDFITDIVDEEYSYFDSKLTDFDRAATIIDIVRKMDKETLGKIQELKEKYK